MYDNDSFWIGFVVAVVVVGLVIGGIVLPSIKFNVYDSCKNQGYYIVSKSDNKYITCKAKTITYDRSKVN